VVNNKNQYLVSQYENNQNYNIKEIGNGDICYTFCPSNGLCYRDVHQPELIRNKTNVYCLAMKSEYHGFNIFPRCYSALFTYDIEKLKLISRKYDGKIISLRKMAFIILDEKSATKEYWKDIVRCYKSLQKIDNKLNMKYKDR
jgi:hypothetical protein